MESISLSTAHSKNVSFLNMECLFVKLVERPRLQELNQSRYTRRGAAQTPLSIYRGSVDMSIAHSDISITIYFRYIAQAYFRRGPLWARSDLGLSPNLLGSTTRDPDWQLAPHPTVWCSPPSVGDYTEHASMLPDDASSSSSPAVADHDSGGQGQVGLVWAEDNRAQGLSTQTKTLLHLLLETLRSFKRSQARQHPPGSFSGDGDESVGRPSGTPDPPRDIWSPQPEY